MMSKLTDFEQSITIEDIIEVLLKAKERNENA